MRNSKYPHYLKIGLFFAGGEFFPRVLAVLFCLFGAAALRANIPGGGTGTGANVTLTTSGTTTTMSNGIVSIVIAQTSAQVTTINYTFNNTGTTQTLNLLSGNSNGGKLYWEHSNNQGLTFTNYTVVANPLVASNGNAVGDYAEVSMITTTQANMPFEVHFSMKRGSPGFYVAGIYIHSSAEGAYSLGECRDNIYAGGIFNWMSVDATRNKLMQVTGGTSTSVPTAPVECSLWTSGIYQGRYEDKYKYSATFGDHRVWGWSSVGASGKNVGLWNVSASTEYYNGGPLKPELMCHLGTTILNMINGNHYGMTTDNDWVAGETLADGTTPWSKVCGPYFIYCNNVSKTNAAYASDMVAASQALYNDALAQAAAETTAWPYSWFLSPYYAGPANRGTVMGKIVINDAYNPNASAANLWVGVIQQPITSNNTYDFQQWTKPYQFWVKTDASGNFTIPAVIAGTNYTLYAFGPGAPGTFMSQAQTGGSPAVLEDIPASPFAVAVTGGATTALGNVTWTPPRVGPTVFEIGYPDRTSRKFRHGDDYWVGDIGPSPSSPSPVWSKWLEYPFDFPSGVNYTVGTSRWTTDWNFIQPVVNSSTGTWNSSSSTINFNLTAKPASGTQASLYLGIASDYYTALVVSVNGTTLVSNGTTIIATPSSHPNTGFVPTSSRSDGSIREYSSGGFSDERITIPGTMLVAGANTIKISQRQVGGTYFANHAMYDYLRLELTGYVPVAPASATAFPGNNCVLVSWPVVSGATSYNILRSTVNGSGYTNVASGVTGPGAGSGPTNATYLDTTALNGTTYYYVVQSVNPVNASANSPQTAAATPSTGGATTAPLSPTGLTTTPGNGAVTLSWNPSATADYYTVKRTVLTLNGGNSTVLPNTNPLTTITLNNAVTGTTYTDASPTNGTIYSYTVTATNSAGASVESTASSTTPVADAPTVGPTNLTATALQNASSGNVVLNWSAVPGAVGYVVQRSTTLAGTYTLLESVSALTDTDSGLAANTTYYYQVATMNSGGTSPFITVSATTPPAAPTPFTATAGVSKVTLTWTAATGATSYVVSRGTVTGGPYTVIASGVTGTSYVDLAVNSGTPYYYVVAATGAGGTGLASVEATATPTGVTTLVWTGATSTAWDTTTSNWLNGTTAVAYSDGVNVSFDDTATTTTVVISPDVSPNDVVFNNSTKNYTVSGAALAGTTDVTKSGTGTLAITGANTYTGGTTITAGAVTLGGNVLANGQTGLGTGTITLQGGTLNMNGYTGSTGGSGYGVLANPINIPNGATGTLRMTQRGGQSGAVTGSGTLSLQINYIRGDISGDWSAFAGQINVTRTRTGTTVDNFRINGTTGFGAAAINLGPYVQISALLNASTTYSIGELSSADTTSQLAGVINNNNASANYTTTYLIGGRNTNATFAGALTNGTSTTTTNANRTVITKEGTGTWTLTGASTYTGTTTVTGGTLSLLGSINTGNTAEIATGGTVNLSGGILTMSTVHIATGGALTGCGTINAALVNDGTVSCGCGSPGKLIVNGTITNNGFMQFTAGTGLQNSSTFTNNGTLDLITGIQSLPANFTNNGIVLDSSSVRVLQIFSSGANMQLVINSVSGHSYQLQRRDSLTTGTWVNVGTAVSGNNANLTLTDPGTSANPQGFYRIVVAP